MRFEWDARKAEANRKKHRVAERGENIRIISARRANARERREHDR
jgi:uncharacterized DUF497 family protein